VIFNESVERYPWRPMGGAQAVSRFEHEF
jgi:hypothetical protein